MRAIAVCLVVTLGCAPTIDGLLERQRAVDGDDARRLEEQLAALPHALGAHVTLRRPSADPYTLVRTPGSAAVLVLVDARADRETTARQSAELVAGVAPEIAAPSIVVDMGAAPAAVPSRSAAGLAALLAAIAVLAGAFAWRERWRVSTNAG